MSSPYVPYCGSPPIPAELWSRWNLDPALLVGIVVESLATWTLDPCAGP